MSVAKKLNKLHIPEDVILFLDEQMANIDTDIAIAMSFVRRAQSLTFKSLDKRISGIDISLMQRYMQLSYAPMRPLHVVAAFSWLTMVPMTAFYQHMRVKEYYRGMDDSAVEVLMCIGLLPSNQFELALDMIVNLLSLKERQAFLSFKEKTVSDTGTLPNYNHLFPPDVLDINDFAIDYYQSLSHTIRDFRIKHQISKDNISQVLGLSVEQYNKLEDHRKTYSLPVAVGFRGKLGFSLHSHVDFTSQMVQFPQFHQLRQVQHIRDSLIVEAIRPLSKKKKGCVTEILRNLSTMYMKM
ncbi:conserved hypothetical protein [Vibrio nigripulchritudo SOn1]|uniref:HTH cro/C1-type domain-containing protein n=1 Tax=Vibrio nigripulchritudo SOn1 TaxID=1238450 RepID=A0AAV2VPP7_9VIBR|nr:hypothetical protein [Vibrio nigripulchritudo]CCO46651.1 conserved hypothetical protein [Vibrio nigripulchritudo SOn1]